MKHYKLLLVLAIAGCLNSGSGKPHKFIHEKSSKETFNSYDLSHPSRTWNLPEELKEISGQAWVDKDHLLAIEDFHPKLYLLRMDEPLTIEQTSSFKETTKEKFDIEDVAIVNNTVYALWSHGAIYKIADWRTNPKVKKLTTSLSKENNTECLCFDPVSHNLLIACKNETAGEDEKKSTRAIYEFNLANETLKPEPFLLIHKKDFLKVTDEKLQFFPSAIAVHPFTHDIYILSTKDNKCMARYNYQGKLLSLQFIDKDLMPQPEGICFSPQGTLYISTQGRHGKAAAIFEFAYSK